MALYFVVGFQRVAIFGSGAIGGYFGGKLAGQANHLNIKLTLIARNQHLAAMKSNGLVVRSLDNTSICARENENVKFWSSSETDSLGHQVRVRSIRNTSHRLVHTCEATIFRLGFRSKHCGAKISSLVF